MLFIYRSELRTCFCIQSSRCRPLKLNELPPSYIKLKLVHFCVSIHGYYLGYSTWLLYSGRDFILAHRRASHQAATRSNFILAQNSGDESSEVFNFSKNPAFTRVFSHTCFNVRWILGSSRSLKNASVWSARSNVLPLHDVATTCCSSEPGRCRGGSRSEDAMLLAG